MKNLMSHIKSALIMAGITAAGAVIGMIGADQSLNRFKSIEAYQVIVTIGTVAGLITFMGLVGFDLLKARHAGNTRAAAATMETVRAYSAIIGSLIFPIIGITVGLLTGVSPFSTLAFTGAAIIWGLLAVLPMCLILVVLAKSTAPQVVTFREKQTAYFAELGFRFTPLRIILMSLSAGIGEEVLFRGALQGWFSQHMPILLAIIIPAIIFGALHYVNKTYMVLAGLIGIYLGGLFAITGNILAPIIAHTLYDVVAFIYTARLVKEYHARIDSENIIDLTDPTS